MNGTYQKAFGRLMAIVILLGMVMRFVNLDGKVFNYDESFTALRVSGHTETELVQAIANGSVQTLGELNTQYQQYQPNISVNGTLYGLVTEEPQLTPLYYLGIRQWAHWFGSSLGTLRAFSAVAALLAFPCFYWLCLELFRSHFTATIATAFYAVSPHHLLFAQQMRHYSWWTVTMLLASILLLRALRSQASWQASETEIDRKRWVITPWIWYAIALTISFYTGLLSVLLAFGHAIYVFCLEKFRLTKTTIAYLAASSVATIALLPWVAIVIANWSRVVETTAVATVKRLTLGELFRGWIRQPGRLLFDINLGVSSPLWQRLPQFFFTGLSLAIVVYALYYLWRSTPQRIWLFVYTLIGGTAIGMIVQDFVIGVQDGGGSIQPRYLIACYLGFGLAIGHLFAQQLRNFNLKFWQYKTVQILFVLLLSGSLMSCTMILQSRSWWLNGSPEEVQNEFTAAGIINRSTKPLLISDTNTWGLLYYTHLLKPDTQILAHPSCYSCALPDPQNFQPDLTPLADKGNEIFLFPGATDQLVNYMQQRVKKLETIALPFQGITILRRIEL